MSIVHVSKETKNLVGLVDDKTTIGQFLDELSDSELRALKNRINLQLRLRKK